MRHPWGLELSMEPQRSLEKWHDAEEPRSDDHDDDQQQCPSEGELLVRTEFDACHTHQHIVGGHQGAELMHRLSEQ